MGHRTKKTDKIVISYMILLVLPFIFFFSYEPILTAHCLSFPPLPKEKKKAEF